MLRWLGRLLSIARIGTRRSVTATASTIALEMMPTSDDRQPVPAEQDLNYEFQKRVARSPDAKLRVKLAAHPSARPEILYFLSQDPDIEVRRQVALNPATPAHAHERLVADDEAVVRETLAERIARLLPELPQDDTALVYRLTVRAIEDLAHDRAKAVREALSATLKDVACTPPNIARALAEDAERSVAEPILKGADALRDDDLLTILAALPTSQTTSWVRAAIAKRTRVDERVATAIYESGDIEATGILIDNEGAVIPESTLSRMVEDAVVHKQWQAGLARRPSLPPGLAVRLSGFVDEAVLTLLKQRNDFDGPTAREVMKVMRRRLEWIEQRRGDETPAERARRLHSTGSLDETAVSDALSWHEDEFVRAALALRAGIQGHIVNQILATASPKSITALVWRARLSMRVAIQVQAQIAKIPSPMLLNARNGVDFPLSEAEMESTLAFFDVATPARARH